MYDQNMTCQNIAERNVRTQMMHFWSQQLCSDTKGVDWEEIKRKLALSPPQNFTQQFKILQSEIMNKQKIMFRNNDKCQRSVDESRNQDFNLSGTSPCDSEDISSSSPVSSELPRLCKRYSPLNNFRKNKMPRTFRHLDQDIGRWVKFADRNKNENMKSQRPDKICTKRNFLFTDDLNKKPKYRLLLNPAMRRKLEKEFPLYAHDLEFIMKMKFYSLRIPVEIAAYTRMDKHRTSDKTFTVTFQSSTYARAALQLVDLGHLDFQMNEARPSPCYHVKFIVLCTVSVYESKCFNRRVPDLQQGDIVTANQERGNKLRIIKHCPRGSKFLHEFKGWVQFHTKEKELLKRIELVDGEIVLKERRLSFTKKQYSKQISPKYLPLRALDQVQVYNGDKEPFSTVIDQLDPGAVVYVDKLIGSMLRIIRTDACGNIQLTHNAQPKPCGWAMLRRIEDGLPQFEFVSRIPKSYHLETTNHAEYLNHFDQTLMNENQHNRPNYENFEEHPLFREIEEPIRHNSSLSYIDLMSMVKLRLASNSMSSMRDVHGASCKRGYLRSKHRIPITISSYDKHWLAARE